MIEALTFYTDNANEVHILQSGSTIESLHGIFLLIYGVCRHNNVQYAKVCLPKRYVPADYLRRCLDSDVWSIAEPLFITLDDIWNRT